VAAGRARTLLTFPAGGVGGFEPDLLAGALGGQGRGRGILRIERAEFFLQAVIGEDALDTALADREVGLAELLGNDLGGGLRVQKAVAQDLAHGVYWTLSNQQPSREIC
jgi:hypothetical protein